MAKIQDFAARREKIEAMPGTSGCTLCCYEGACSGRHHWNADDLKKQAAFRKLDNDITRAMLCEAGLIR